MSTSWSCCGQVVSVSRNCCGEVVNVSRSGCGQAVSGSRSCCGQVVSGSLSGWSQVVSASQSCCGQGVRELQMSIAPSTGRQSERMLFGCAQGVRSWWRPSRVGPHYVIVARRLTRAASNRWARQPERISAIGVAKSRANPHIVC